MSRKTSFELSSTSPVTKSQTKNTSKNLNQYIFTAKNYVSKDPSLQKFTFNYSPVLEVVVKDANLASRRIKLKPVGEEIEESYYISLDEPGQSLGEGIRVDKPGEEVSFGENRYYRLNVYYDLENKLVMVIFDPQSPLELGDIYVSWWDEGRREEALREAKIILESLRQVK